jgi:D-lactate dehydrogenase (cytochrome)
MMHFYDEKLNASGMEHLMFGHIGESHMHANLLPGNEKEYALSKQTYLLLVDKALSLGGTVSAEHGIGKLKHAFVQRMLGEEGMREMARLKRTLDPACILGPGNLIPAPLLKEL